MRGFYEGFQIFDNLSLLTRPLNKTARQLTTIGNKRKRLSAVRNSHGEAGMARSKVTYSKKYNDEISVSIFKDIHIHFTGDVYLFAVWVAMSDRAKSTSTCKRQTTLNGLASKFTSAYGIDYSNPLNADDVMAIFRRHGIKGNPGLRLEDEGETPPKTGDKLHSA